MKKEFVKEYFKNFVIIIISFILAFIIIVIPTIIVGYLLNEDIALVFAVIYIIALYALVTTITEHEKNNDKKKAKEIEAMFEKGKKYTMVFTEDKIK